MEIMDKVIVITGGASGIGRAMARRFTSEGAKQIVLADLNVDGLEAVAQEVGARAIPANISIEADVKALIETTEKDYGQIDLLCNNAGIGVGGGPETPNDDWQKIWEINVMAHVYAARAAIPQAIFLFVPRDRSPRCTFTRRPFAVRVSESYICSVLTTKSLATRPAICVRAETPRQDNQRQKNCGRTQNLFPQCLAMQRSRPCSPPDPASTRARAPTAASADDGAIDDAIDADADGEDVARRARGHAQLFRSTCESTVRMFHTQVVHLLIHP